MALLTSNQVCNICCIHYSAGLRCCALGSLVEGGYLFERYGGLAWIVACSSREVSRVWALRNNAVTVAQASNACGDWFVPALQDLQLAFDRKQFWDSSSIGCYWTSTERTSTTAWRVNFDGGGIDNSPKTGTRCVRAFRRVYY
jgi:hypothetical protein